MANLARSSESSSEGEGYDQSSTQASPLRRMFECRTCNRQFPSFQALGGHRASHMKPRVGSEEQVAGGARTRAHECSVCGLEFAIGQALGGHMRRHRSAGSKGFREKKTSNEKRVVCLDLDLNLPPPEDNDIECCMQTRD